MQSIVLIIHIIVAIAMTGLILIQHGKGADAGASFGAGGAGAVLGAAGTGNFLTRTTGILTAIFFVTSLTLAVFAKQQAEGLYNLDAPVATELSDEQAPKLAAPKPLTDNPETE